MSSLEMLRLLVAVLHPVQDGHAMLHCHNGQRIDVGHHPSADLTPCQLRQVIIASGCHGRPDYSRLVATAELCGAFEPMGGGLYRRCDSGHVEQRWFATLLPTDVVMAALADMDCALDAELFPDCAVGATAVCLTAANSESRPHLDELAVRTLAACMADELIHHTQHARR